MKSSEFNTGGSLSRVFFLHVLAGYVKPGLEASQEKPGMNQLISVGFLCFFKCRHDMFGIEFTIMSFQEC